MEAINNLRERAKQVKSKIILPEGDEERVIKAAAFISKEKIADVVLLSLSNDTHKKLKNYQADASRIEIINIKEYSQLDKYINMFHEIRKHKNLTIDEARNIILSNTLYLGALMVKDKSADGFVAGSVNTTRDVARSALWCIGLDRAVGTMSSSFVMIFPDKNFGENGILIYADCGIIPFPSPKQLASIAITSGDLMKIIFSAEPKIAMLSFSTKGSGKIPETEKILNAINMINEKRPDLLVDGELQADAALVPQVAELKAPGSPIKGKANVLIFPNLEAGNISYKLSQRLTGARALGPLLNGLAAPCSDLSRGCSWEDVVDIVAVTALRHAYGNYNK